METTQTNKNNRQKVKGSFRSVQAKARAHYVEYRGLEVDRACKDWLNKRGLL